MKSLELLKIKIFADGANKDSILHWADKDYIQGFTTNPTLMKKSGVKDYEEFAKDIIPCIGGRPISFEVFSDDFEEMEKQALKISSWGGNIYVKIPIINTKRESSFSLIKRLSDKGVKVNVTAIFTLDQVEGILGALNRDVPCVLSVFAGRVADTGIDPVPLMINIKKKLEKFPAAELLWASPREVINIFQGDICQCDIITVSDSILDKLSLLGKNLEEYSLETVEMFYRDALEVGYFIS